MKYLFSKIKPLIFIASYFFTVFYGLSLINNVANFKEIYSHYIGKEAVLKASDLKLIFDEGRTIVYYQDKEFTSGQGISSSFFINGKLYSTSTATWKVDRISPVELIVTASWQGLSLKQIWKLSLENEHLNWQVDLENEAGLSLKDLSFVLYLNDNYKEWVDIYERGVMPKISFWQQFVPDKTAIFPSVIGFDGSRSGNSFLPALVFSLDKSKSLSKISLQKFYSTYYKIPSSAILVSGFNRSITFKGKSLPVFRSQMLFFNKNQDLAGHIQELRSLQEISQGDLRLFFDRGKAQIYYKGIELTRDEGIHILLQSAGRWYSSTVHVTWEVEKINTNKMVIKGKWLDLPIFQVIEFEISSINTINCKVDLQLYKNINLQQWSFVFMLPGIFKDYLLPNQSEPKSFPNSFINDNYWQDVWQGNLKIAPQAKIIDKLNGTSVALNCPQMPEDWRLVISNTNQRHMSRAIICNKTYANNSELTAGKYPFFIGDIVVK